MKRVLIKYHKKGYAAYLSHKETIRLLEKALRRSGLPLAFTGGYNPHPRMSFSPALPLGVRAEAEYLEVTLEGEADLEEAVGKINDALPEGLRVDYMEALPPGMPKLSRWVLYGLYRVGDGEGADYILLGLSGEKQGRLRDALDRLSASRGMVLGREDVTRVGLYASSDEVFEEIDGPVLYFNARKGVLEEMVGESS